VIALLGGCLATSTAAWAQSTTTSEPTATTERGVGALPPDVVDAAIRLAKTSEQLLASERELADVQKQQEDVRAVLGELDARISTTGDRLATLKASVRARAAEVYVRRGSGPLLPPVIDNRQTLNAGQSYAAAANSVDDAQIDALARMQDRLAEDRQKRVEARDALERTALDLIQTQSDLRRLQADAQQRLNEWGGVTVLGPAALTADQLTAWFESTHVRPNLPAGLQISDLAHLFIDEGELAGVRGDLAFAQSIIETGSFTEFKGYNFSGIGVCDSCTGGLLFDAARDGVRAQMQLLRNYADPSSRAADLPVPLSPVLYGSDPVEAARLFDTFFLKGSAPVWNAMGGGNWATDPNYAGKVLSTYARMIAFVAKAS